MPSNKDLGTWREDTVDVPAKSVVTYTFGDTVPNYFFISNGGNTNCYLGIKRIPSKTVHDLDILPHTQRIINMFHGTTQIYFYNDGTDAIKVLLKSFVWDFDPLVLAQTESGSSGGSSGGGTFDGIITGFTAPLPSGGNRIGTVDLASPIPAGSATIGNVGVVGDVTPKRLSGSPAHGSATTTATQVYANAVTISFFSNDGGTSIFIGKSAGTADLEIKAGEALSDVPWKGPLYVQSSDGSVSYRAVAGVE